MRLTSDSLPKAFIVSKLAIAINKAQQNNPAKWGAPNMKTATTRVDKLLESETLPKMCCLG